MDPVTAAPISVSETVADEDLLVLGNLAEPEGVAQEGEVEKVDEDEEDEDDEDDDEDDDDEDDDEDDDDEDDEVGTDENGNEMLKIEDEPATDRPPEQQAQAANVSSDRVPATDAEPEGSLDRVKAGALGIEEIENMEDDAMGG